jgi:mannose-6-phosphate isomerase
MKAKTAAGKVAPKKMDGFTRLIDQKYFAVDRFDLASASEVIVSCDGPGCLVALSGSGVVRCGGDEVKLMTALAVVVPAGRGDVTVQTDSSVSFVRCVAPV